MRRQVEAFAGGGVRRENTNLTLKDGQGIVQRLGRERSPLGLNHGNLTWGARGVNSS